MVAEPKSKGANLTASTDEKQAEAKAPVNPPESSVLERRREPRYPCNDPVMVRVSPGDGNRLPATLIDVSRSGLRLEIGVPLIKGGEIEIVLRQSTALPAQRGKVPSRRVDSGGILLLKSERPRF